MGLHTNIRARYARLGLTGKYEKTRSHEEVLRFGRYIQMDKMSEVTGQSNSQNADANGLPGSAAQNIVSNHPKYHTGRICEI